MFFHLTFCHFYAIIIMAPGKNCPRWKGEEMERRSSTDAMLAVAAYIARRNASFWDWIALMEKYHPLSDWSAAAADRAKLVSRLA